MGYIYRIQNIKNGKFYIGSSYNFYNRMSEHFSALRRNRHHNKYLQSSFHKYGEYAFVCGIIDETNNRDLRSLEKEWILKLEPDYNLSTETCGSNYWLGKIRSQETKNKIAIKLIGRPTGRKGLKNNISKEGREVLMLKSIETKPRLHTSKYGKIVRIDKDQIKIYNDLRDVVDDLNLSTSKQSHIIRACKQSYRTAFGYKWKFYDQLKSSELLETPVEDNQQPS